ncbi:cytosine permease [Limisphaera ngatamarikiensis]|uniref:Cytosine permease n=1 Tax=Limisphaera ngatamarikiensis TaxID=1324935 RepID=A0A6M1RJV9_9BACT|nr:cytosine permease [Limisphaera ngatamarikiensis]NGO37859.1 cytosine permease [Limisphaera ngatamarikiensis]
MNETTPQPATSLPGYITSATPNPMDKRAPWYKNTAPTYAGIFLWFVFWDPVTNGGQSLSAGLGVALLGLLLSALACHYLFYLVPGLFGMRTGLPLYIVGTSTFGAQGGFIMPGFLMGVLQFGWLGVNAFFSSMLLYNTFSGGSLTADSTYPVPGHAILVVIWAALAAFMGLKGIQYVAKVATYLPLLPLIILLILFVKTVGGVGSFDPQVLVKAGKVAQPLSAGAVIALMLTYVVGFFATAGAAGVDFGLNNRDKKDVQMGGLVGIGLAILVTAGLSLLIVAGAYGQAGANSPEGVTATSLMVSVVGEKAAKVFWLLLALAAFPPACFSSFIAANSFKTTLPKVNPFVSVGIGTVVSIVLAMFGWAGKLVAVFTIIGASFGPICGAMVADYLLSGGRWTGPRAGFNPAGWLAWALGFVVGILPNLNVAVPAAPVLAFVVGFVVYFVASKIGLQSPVVPLSGPLAEATK